MYQKNMKKLFLGACTLTSAASLFSQGTVIFDNRVAGTVVTHVYGPDPANIYNYVSGMGVDDFPSGNVTWGGQLLQGSGFSAQLWAAQGFNMPEGSLQPASPITSFRTGTDAGFLAGTTATLTGVPSDSPSATLVLRVWDNQGGIIHTWPQALNAGTAHGESPLFNLVNIGGGVNAAPALVGLQSFNIWQIPEPSTLALVCLGAAAALIFRHRRNRSDAFPPREE
jgi:hypothetical protein